MDDRAALIRELLEAGVPLDEARSHVGPMAEIAEYADLYDRSIEERMYQTIARRSGKPYSRVVQEWSNWEDVLREFGWDIHLAKEELRRCPDCGIDHDDVRDPDDLRPLENGVYKLVKTDCWVNAERDRAKENRLTDDEKTAGVTFQLRPRAPGEPWIDDGTEPRED